MSTPESPNNHGRSKGNLRYGIAAVLAALAGTVLAHSIDHSIRSDKRQEPQEQPGDGALQEAKANTENAKGEFDAAVTATLEAATSSQNRTSNQPPCSYTKGSSPLGVAEETLTAYNDKGTEVYTLTLQTNPSTTGIQITHIKPGPGGGDVTTITSDPVSAGYSIARNGQTTSSFSISAASGPIEYTSGGKDLQNPYTTTAAAAMLCKVAADVTDRRDVGVKD